MILYLCCGHGDGDPGACAGGYTEAERVRTLAHAIVAANDSVDLMDENVNWYATRGLDSYTFPSDACVIELHMDSAAETAHGAHVIIPAGLDADAYDEALASKLSALMPGRAQTIVSRSDLRNCNIAKKRGINYRLVEFGFISNEDDRSIFNANISHIAQLVLESFGLAANETAEPSTPAPEPAEKDDGWVDPAESPLLHDGYFGPLTVRYIQMMLRAKGYYPSSLYLMDDVWGYYTKHALQQYLRDKGYYKRECDGDFGYYSVYALQAYLLDRRTYWQWVDGARARCYIDGDFGSYTVQAIQRAINAGIL